MPIDIMEQSRIQTELVATINAYLAVRQAQTGAIHVSDVNAILAALSTVTDAVICQSVEGINASRKAAGLDILPV
jgi:hypothetical protein